MKIMNIEQEYIIGKSLLKHHWMAALMDLSQNLISGKPQINSLIHIY